MRSQESVTDRIRKTRSNLEERFGAFERSLFQEISRHDGISDPLPTQRRATHEAEDVASGTDETLEVSGLKKSLEEEKARNQTLENAMDGLRNSLQEMGMERKELVDRMRQAEQTGRVPAPGTGPRKEQDKSKRLKIARRWRKWRRESKVLLKKASAQNEESLKQIAILNCELDAAMELVAEQRDELHSISR